jgi:hypothetical protein
MFVGDEERVGSLLDKGRKCCVDAAFCVGAHDVDLLPDRACRLLQVSQLEVYIRIVRIHKHTNHQGFGNKLM